MAILSQVVEVGTSATLLSPAPRDREQGSSVGVYSVAADVALTAGSDTNVITTPLLREGTYEFDARAMCSGSTLAGNADLYLAAGTATMANINGAGATLSNGTAANVWTLAAHGAFQVTAPGTVNMVVHPNAGMTGTLLAKKNTPLMGKSSATTLTLRKIA